MNNNLKILKFFVENKDKEFTIKKVAETLNINYRIAYEEIMSLKEENLIRIKKQGNSNISKFNYNYSSKNVEVEHIRKKELFKNRNIKLIHNRIKEIKNPFYILILFGSYADKSNTKSSDIDICLITDNKKVNKQVNDIVSITPLNLHLQEFTTHDFLKMIKSKETNVGNDIIKNNIILYGIESFYKLVNNVKY